QDSDDADQDQDSPKNTEPLISPFPDNSLPTPSLPVSNQVPRQPTPPTSLMAIFSQIEKQEEIDTLAEPKESRPHHPPSFDDLNDQPTNASNTNFSPVLIPSSLPLSTAPGTLTLVSIGSTPSSLAP